MPSDLALWRRLEQRSARVPQIAQYVTPATVRPDHARFGPQGYGRRPWKCGCDRTLAYAAKALAGVVSRQTGWPASARMSTLKYTIALTDGNSL